MYSNDDRLRAVQHYIKLGKRAGLTIRQLGHTPVPSETWSWHSKLLLERMCRA
jgi:hypothetical protein